MQRLLQTFAAALLLAYAGAASAATTFQFQFDNAGFGEPGGTVTPPIVGMGQFVSPIDLTPGLYALDSLPGFTLSFMFPTTSYTEADIVTPLAGVAVGITAAGPDLRLVFTETGAPGSDGGPGIGALDLSAFGQLLSFEPTFAGGNDEYYLAGEAGSLVGNYLALSAVPEPASMTLLGGGLLLLGMRRRA